MDNFITKEILIKFIVKEIDSDREVFKSQLNYFLIHLDELRNAGSDTAKQGYLAHKIRAGCQIFGAMKLESALKQIEIKARSNLLKINSELFINTIVIINPTLLEINKISDDFFEGTKKSG